MIINGEFRAIRISPETFLIVSRLLKIKNFSSCYVWLIETFLLLSCRLYIDRGRSLV